MRAKILSEADFSARIRALEALCAIADGESPSHDLAEVAEQLDGLSVSYSSAEAANAYGGLAGLLRIFNGLVQWQTAVILAQTDADRFLRSAKERYKLWVSEYTGLLEAHSLLSASGTIATIAALEQVAEVARLVAAVPLPIGVFAAERRSFIPGSTEREDAKRPSAESLKVAFLKFQIDGLPASSIHHLTPTEVHDLEVEVRVSRWPESKSELRLTPLTVEPKNSYDFPTFAFERPSGEGPYSLGKRGRAMLYVSQGLNARPFEFKYTAEFLPKDAEQPVAVVGHRTLLIDGVDLAKTKLCGYPVLDARLMQVREELRRRPGVPTDEIADTLSILLPMCNLAGQAVQDSMFPDPVGEAEFQTRVRAHLRADPNIGQHLDEHAHATGGITDLSLRGIPIELKVEPGATIGVVDCERFVAQAASYAVGKGKRTAVLCVLNCRQGKVPPRDLATLFAVHHHAGTNVAVCIVVVQGGLAKPSSLSR
jgi:hypothetical protein